jgi:hypothetical protein
MERRIINKEMALESHDDCLVLESIGGANDGTRMALSPEQYIKLIETLANMALAAIDSPRKFRISAPDPITGEVTVRELSSAHWKE